MIKILIFHPEPNSGHSIARALGPISYLPRDRYSYSFWPNEPRQITWPAWWLSYDILHFSLPNHENFYLYAALEGKKWGKKIVLDWDDAYFHVPADNPHAGLWNDPRTVNALKQFLDLADVITVVSELQKREMIDAYNVSAHRIFVVPNALDDRLLCYQKPFASHSRRLAWRGSASHSGDLAFFKEAINGAIQESETCFFGIDPGKLGIRARNVSYAPVANFIDFIAGFTEFNPAVLFIPLVDSFFNRVKSPLAWIDGTLAGAVCLCPSAPNWKLPGMFSYGFGDTAHFKERLRESIECSDEELSRFVEISKEWQRDNILLSKVNLMRENIFSHL